MKVFPVFVLTCLCLLLSGCATFSTTYDYDYDSSVDFSILKDYRILDISTGPWTDAFVAQRVQNAIHNTMQGKGFVQTTEPADFLVSFQEFREAIRHGKSRGTSMNNYKGYETRDDFFEHIETTLTISILDGSGRNLLWKGSAIVKLDANLLAEEKVEKTNVIVSELLKNFPPR